MTSLNSSITNYYNLLSTYNVSNPTNFIYGTTTNQNLSNTISTSTSKSSQSTSTTLSSYLTSLNSNVNALKDSAKILTRTNTNLSFDKRVLSSSDSTAVTGTAASNATLGAHTINVSKLATSQVNTGAKLDSNQKSFSQGLNTFTLKSGNSTALNLSFNVSSSDTNKSVLGKMASSINTANAGITANVVSDSKTGKSYLSLASDKTGASSTFTLTSTAGTAIATSGIGTTTVQAQDAQYTLDGKKYTSQDNNIKIDSGKIQLTLKKSDSKDLQINTSSDISSIKDDIKKLVSNYNTLMNFANDNSSNFSGAQSLKYEISASANSRKSTLNSIGITINSDKTLSIDDKKLSSSLSYSSYSVKSIIGGNTGLAQDLSNKSTKVLSSQAKYSNPLNLNSSYSSLSYGQNMYTGLLLNSLV